jgi:hypothetical protein
MVISLSFYFIYNLSKYINGQGANGIRLISFVYYLKNIYFVWINLIKFKIFYFLLFEIKYWK